MAAAPDRHLGLPQVVRRHAPAPRREHGLDPRRDLVVELELDAHDPGDGVAGDVVLGRPEPAAHDDGVGPVEGGGAGRDSMRSRLSPTSVVKRGSMPASASCSPSQAELVSTIWPSSSSVPTATISHRMPLGAGQRRPLARVPRLPSTKYWTPGHHGERDRQPQRCASATQSRRRAAGTRASDDGDGLHDRLELAALGRGDGQAPPGPEAAEEADRHLPGGDDGHGRRPRTTSAATSAHMAPSTSTLSASGSRNAPDRVVPCWRAIQPSTPSVAESTIQKASVVHDDGRLERSEQEQRDRRAAAGAR